MRWLQRNTLQRPELYATRRRHALLPPPTRKIGQQMSADATQPPNDRKTGGHDSLRTLARYWDHIQDILEQDSSMSGNDANDKLTSARELRARSATAPDPTVATLCQFAAMRAEGSLTDKEIFVAWFMGRKENEEIDSDKMAAWCRERLESTPGFSEAGINVEAVDWHVIWELVLQNHLESIGQM